MASQAHRNLTRCPKGGKRRFRDQTEAVDALHFAAAARHAADQVGRDSSRRECRAYLCPSCRGWHLTSSAAIPTATSGLGAA